MNPLDWFTGIAQVIAGWYTEGVKQTINILLTYSVPSPDEIKSKFFTLALGGTFGLSALIVGGMSVLIGSLVVLRINEDHSKKISKLFNSVVLLLLFALLFFRGYSLLYATFQGGVQGALNVLTGTENGTITQLNNVLLSVTPQAVGAMVFLGPFSALFSILTMVEAFVFHVAIIALLITYPLLIATRPLPVFNTLFHAANAAMVVIALAPTTMAWAYALPIIVTNAWPGALVVPGLVVVLTFAGSFLAFVIPIVLAFFMFTTSRNVFGRVDATVQGAVSVLSMPPVDLNEVRRDIDHVHASSIRAVVTDVVGDEILSGDMFSDMKKVAINLAATATAVAGHPYASTLIKAAPTVYANAKERFSSTTSETPGGGDDET